MTDSARRVYRTLGLAFVSLGGGVALVSLLDRIANLGLFRGSPLGTGLFLVVVGALLLQAVAQGARRGNRDPGGDAAGPEREGPPAP
jgi:hypothetical protein